MSQVGQRRFPFDNPIPNVLREAILDHLERGKCVFNVRL